MLNNRLHTGKDPEYRKLINSARWRELRRRKLSVNPVCEDCLQNDIVTGATEVHHIIPIESGMSFSEKSRLAYDIHNLKSLCHECHIKEHINMGRSGVKAQKRLTKEKLDRFKTRFLMISISISDNKRKITGSLRFSTFHYVIVFCMSMWFVEIAYLFKGCKALPGAAKNKFNKCISLRMSNNKYGSTPFAPTIVKTLLIN